MADSPKPPVEKDAKRGDVNFDRRMLIASGAVAAVAVPVSLLAYATTHAWGPLHNLDSGVATHLHSWALREPGAVGFLQGVSTVLDPWVLRAVAVGAVGILLVRRQRKLARWAGVTVLVAGALGFGLKLLVARSRPSLPDPVSEAPGSSFPSGHALNSMAIIGVLVLLALPAVPRRWRAFVWAGAGLAIATVGFARVALGVHYVSDVFAGWLIGAGLVAATVVAFDTWRRPAPRPPSEVLSEGVDPAGSKAAVGMAQPEPDAGGKVAK